MAGLWETVRREKMEPVNLARFGHITNGFICLGSFLERLSAHTTELLSLFQ